MLMTISAFLTKVCLGSGTDTRIAKLGGPYFKKNGEKKAKKGRRGACLQPGGSAQLSAPPQRDTGAEAPGESPATPNKDCGEKGGAETPPPHWPAPPGESPGGAAVLHPQTMTGVSAGRAARTSTQTNKQGKKKKKNK